MPGLVVSTTLVVVSGVSKPSIFTSIVCPSVSYPFKLAVTFIICLPFVVNVYDVAVAKANVSTYFPSAYTLYVCPLSICSFV